MTPKEKTPQTAVKWLVKQLNDKVDFIPLNKWDEIRDLVAQAKEMEKQQIEDAYEAANVRYTNDSESGEQYYNETFKK